MIKRFPCLARPARVSLPRPHLQTTTTKENATERHKTHLTEHFKMNCHLISNFNCLLKALTQHGRHHLQLPGKPAIFFHHSLTRILLRLGAVNYLPRLIYVCQRAAAFCMSFVEWDGSLFLIFISQLFVLMLPLSTDLFLTVAKQPVSLKWWVADASVQRWRFATGRHCLSLANRNVDGTERQINLRQNWSQPFGVGRECLIRKR